LRRGYSATRDVDAILNSLADLEQAPARADGARAAVNYLKCRLTDISNMD
jgi:hypothetical protein